MSPTTRAGRALNERTNSPATVNVLGVRVDSVDMERVLARIQSLVVRREKGYVCAASVHGVLEAQHNPHVMQAFADAAVVIPDGRPMAWVGRAQGHSDIRQVTGPYLMRAIFSSPEFARCSHFFYGGKEGVAEELAARWIAEFPSTRVAGTFTPPYRDLTPAEESELVDRLNRSKPDIVWVGISAPRQEMLMRRLLPYLDHGVMFGVGAAFDFHTGRIRDCAPWIKRLGLQWLHRLMQDPRRLWRRNLFNTTFLWHIALQISGLKRYVPQPPSAESARAGRYQPTSAASNSSVTESA